MKLLRIVLLTALFSMTFIPSQTLVLSRNLSFQDVNDSYAIDSIISLTEKDIMKGTTPSTFSPTQSITRAEFLVTLNRLLGLEPVSSSVAAYKDVRQKDWYYSAIQAATAAGLTEGLGSGRFAPHNNLTRQEAAIWLQKITAAPSASAADIQRLEFRDHAAISSWASGAVYAMVKLQYIQGSEGKFEPQRALTRQEAAVLLDRLLQDTTWANRLDSKLPDRIQLGWQYQQSDAEFKLSVMASNVNVLSPRWFFLNANSGISDNGNSDLVSWAHQQGKKVWALFGNRMNQEHTHALLSSPAKTSAAIKEVVQLAQQYGLDGINLDFENVAPKDREAFTSFVTELAAQLHNKGLTLSVDVSPDLGTDWTEAFDYAALGKQADYIVLMGYDEHWSGGTAGSVASLPWVTQGLDTLLKEVAAAQVILGLPLYTREWKVGASGATLESKDLRLGEQLETISRLGLQPGWNSTLSQYQTSYAAGGSPHHIWLEESRSLSSKYIMGLERKVAGFAYWHIGGDTSDIWPALRNADKYQALTAR